MPYLSKADKAHNARIYYHENRERIRKVRAEQFANESTIAPEKQLLRGAKHRAKQKGLPFSITVEDIPIPAICPVLGVVIRKSFLIADDHSPTIDQIVPGGGYVPGNVRVISYRANRLKCDATLAELELILADIRKLPTTTKE